MKKRTHRLAHEQTIQEIQAWALGPQSPMDPKLARASRELWPGAAAQAAMEAGLADARGEPWRLRSWLDAARALEPASAAELAGRPSYGSGYMAQELAQAWWLGEGVDWVAKAPEVLPCAAALGEALGWSGAGPGRPIDRALGVALSHAMRASEDRQAKLGALRLWLLAGADPNAQVQVGSVKPRSPLEAALESPTAWECAAVLADRGGRAGLDFSAKAAKAIQCALTQREPGFRPDSSWGAKESARRVASAVAIAKGLGALEDFRTKKGHGFGRLAARSVFGLGRPQPETCFALRGSEWIWQPQDFADLADGLMRAKRSHKMEAWAAAARLIGPNAVADARWDLAFDDARRRAPWDATLFANWILAWGRQSEWAGPTLNSLAIEARRWGDESSASESAADAMENAVCGLWALAQAREIEKVALAPAARARVKGL